MANIGRSDGLREIGAGSAWARDPKGELLEAHACCIQMTLPDYRRQRRWGPPETTVRSPRIRRRGYDRPRRHRYPTKPYQDDHAIWSIA